MNADNPEVLRSGGASGVAGISTFMSRTQPKLTMRGKAHTLDAVVIRFAVDENEIRPDGAVALMVPGQLVIEIPPRQAHFSIVVALKACGVINLPHSDFAAVCPACQP